MAKLEVAFSPDLYPFYENKEAIVVVIDVFRATSAICTAFEHGVKSIIPVESIDQAREYQKKGYIVAAERQGQVVEGFNLGNSPFHYMDKGLVGKEVVLTTTNGTRAISIAKSSHQIIIGSFLNLTAVCDYLKGEKRDVLLLCAGWRGRFNLEDSLFAGAVVLELSGEYFKELSDSARAAQTFYNVGENNIGEFLENSSHRRRLKNLNLEKDINYCLQFDQTKVVPALEGEGLVAVK